MTSSAAATTASGDRVASMRTNRSPEAVVAAAEDVVERLL